ncbi:molybdenum cofactor biosynthesis protein B [Methylophaga pinxianii]|uniref:molybdenum cofactor biosynthesis protein B n=1 Tax=Methylophaga pinxianii TaxID=2881052 RepID=UPI001CF4C34E|nr:molybdenum cofactor biosynthesis protein B [Methylophaga pinxianii]MCB2426614.1 molybdenum cofactor biosynthesis protein B [Methylophaga pinxianii]UPH45489.1 molybdenum cofactor biosynthesis protein B [Methylophaga pinxianii]
MEQDFIAVKIAILTISDSRTEVDDVSGKTLQDRVIAAGHELADKQIVADDIYQIRAIVSQWICDEQVDVVITTGGTGLTGRDGTPEAVQVLFDKEITGFGELFRQISYDLIRTSTVQSRAIAGVANGTFIFCLPGSSGACKTGWDDILQHQLDIRHRPCNFVELIPRLREK